MNLKFFGLLGIFILVCYVLSALRKRFAGVDKYWRNGVIWLFLTMILIHMGIWWLWPNFWHEWSARSGFLIFQLLLGVGLFFGALKARKEQRWGGIILIALGVIGIGWNVVDALLLNQATAGIMTPSSLQGIPGQDWSNEVLVTKFWKKNLPERSALAMLRIVRRVSGFNQFEKDGKTVYRNPRGGPRIGVMQIDEVRWFERARELGHNLYTLEGNLHFGLWLYGEEGFAPWGVEPEILTLFERMKEKIGGDSKLPISLEQQYRVVRNPKLPSTSNPEVEKEVRDFFTSQSGLPADDVALMIDHARQESGFNQLDSAGNPLRNDGLNPDGTYDTGVMQINSKWLLELASKCTNCDVNTLEGNLNASVYVLRHQGHAAWSPERHRRETPLLTKEKGTRRKVVAPVDDWGEVVLVTQRMSFVPSACIRIMKDNGAVVIGCPDSKFDLGPTRTMRFMSDSTEEAYADITYNK